MLPANFGVGSGEREIATNALEVAAAVPALAGLPLLGGGARLLMPRLLTLIVIGLLLCLRIVWRPLTQYLGHVGAGSTS